MRRQQFGRENGVSGQSYGQQLAEIHANAVPGVTRPEEGEVMLGNRDSDGGSRSKARESLRRDYAQMERSRERERYENYLDEKDSEKLPSAFDLGWQRNLRHLFGGKALLWFLPVCNTTGDGWRWEPNPNWIETRDSIRKEREAQWREDEAFRRDEEDFAQQGRWSQRGVPEGHYLGATNDRSEQRSPGLYFDRDPDGSPSSRMSMQTLRR